MEAQQNFIIEAARQNSVEANAKLNVPNSAWTNRIEPTLLKKGDYISVNTAIINQKGASGQNNIEFNDDYNNPTDNLQQNFTMITMGFYLNNNNVNSVPVPYKYAGLPTTSRHDDFSYKGIRYNASHYRETSVGSGIYNNDNQLGHAKWNQIFATGTGEGTTTDYTINWLGSFSGMNPKMKIDGSRYAKVGNDFKAWFRPLDGGKRSNTINLLKQDIPLHIDRGFKNASNVGEILTQTLQTTNNPFGTTADFAIPQSVLQTRDPFNQTAQTQNNPTFNGYCNKTVGANLQYANEDPPDEDSYENPIYNNLFVRDPYRWENGMRITCNTDTFNLRGLVWVNNAFFGDEDNFTYDYPMFLWATWTGENIITAGNPTNEELANQLNYSIYSPFFTESIPTQGNGNNVIEFSGFSTTMVNYNDYYGEITNIDDTQLTRGIMLFKNGTNTYKFLMPLNDNQMIEDPDDSSAYLAFSAFGDTDSPSFDRILSYSPKNDMEAEYEAIGVELAKKVESSADFDTDYEFTPTGADQFFSATSPFYPYQWNIDGGGSTDNVGLNYIFALNRTGTGIVEGRTYEISFRSEYISGDGSSGAYANAIQLVDRSAFGFSAMTVTSDNLYTQEFKALASYSANNLFMMSYNHPSGGTQKVKIYDFSIRQTSKDDGDIYNINDIFTLSEYQTTKIYSMTIKSGQLRNEKFNLADSTINSGNFNGQYTPYGQYRAYKSGLDVIAIDAVNANDYDDAVILLNTDNADHDHIIYNQFGSRVWRIAKITKYDGGVIQNGTTIGTILDSQEYTFRNPFRSGQQFYDMAGSNTWSYNTPYIDFELGNIWNTNADGSSGAQYPVDNHIYEGLETSRTIYNLADGNTYTGTSSHTCDFQDTSGKNSNGWNYDKIGTLTHGGNTYTLYFQTNAISGLSGKYEYNNSSAGNTWTINNVSSGTITLAGDFVTTLTKSGGSLTTSTLTYAYDYHFDGGSGDIYLHAFTEGGGAYTSGDYEFTTSNGTLIDPQLNGTWSYDSTTGEIDFYRDNGNFYFTLYVGSTGTNPSTTTVVDTTTFTNFISDPLPIYEGLSYSYTVEAFGRTHYLGPNTAETDDDLIGKRGTVKYDDGSIQQATWNWDGNLVIDINDAGLSLTATTKPADTNIIEYTTKLDKNVAGTTYAFPSDGKQYYSNSLSYTAYGEGTNVTDLHLPFVTTSTSIDTLYLSTNLNANWNKSLGYHRGYVYENESDRSTATPVCQWQLEFNEASGWAKFLFIDADDLTTVLLEIETAYSSILKYGWRLTKTSKYSTPLILQQAQTLTVQDSENYFVTSSYLKNNPPSNQTILADGTYSVNSDSGTSKYLSNQNLQQIHADMPQSTMILTNIKFNMDNLKIIKDFYRKTEIYDGNVESSRQDIADDKDGFYSIIDVGRTDDSKLDITRTESPYLSGGSDSKYASQGYFPQFLGTVQEMGMLGVDDSDDTLFNFPNGDPALGTNSNFGMVSPRMKSSNGTEQRLKVFTRWKGNYMNRLIHTNRLYDDFSDPRYETYSLLYGKGLKEAEFASQEPELYNYCVNNNVGVYPYLCRNPQSISYELCMAFETFESMGSGNIKQMKIQNLTYFAYSPSFLDGQYLTSINCDQPFVGGDGMSADFSPYTTKDNYGYAPSNRIQDNMNLINIGASPSIAYNAERNSFEWSYLHQPVKFNTLTGTTDDLEEEVALINDDDIMILQQGIGEFNTFINGSTTADPNTPSKPIHLGIADSQAGVYIHSIYGQTPSKTYITSSGDGVEITRSSYDNTLFWTLGFSWYDLMPFRFSEDSFNNRFNPSTFNTISGNFKNLGTAPFTTNSAVSISDATKSNIFTGVNFQRTYDSNVEVKPDLATQAETPAFYLGYNNLLPVSIKTSSALMTANSVIVNLSAPFYRLHCNLPIDTFTYLSNGSLPVIGYMTKNYINQSFIYSFASDYGGFITRDVLITDLRTEIRDPRGLLVNSIDSNSAVFYKVTRNIVLGSGLTQEQEKQMAENIMQREEEEAEEATEIRAISLDTAKYFNKLYSAGKRGVDTMTEALGEPSGIDAIYQTLQQADIETKEEEQTPALLPALNMNVLKSMTKEEEEQPYTSTQQRLFHEMSVVMEEAITEQTSRLKNGDEEDLQNLDRELRDLQLGGDVLNALISEIGDVSDRKQLRDIVEGIARQANQNETASERKKTATRIMRVLETAQEQAIINNPKLMGKNPLTRRKRDKLFTDPKTGTREIMTEKQREKKEQKAMKGEDPLKRPRGRIPKKILEEKREERTIAEIERERGRQIIKAKEAGLSQAEIRKKFFLIREEKKDEGGGGGGSK